MSSIFGFQPNTGGGGGGAVSGDYVTLDTEQDVTGLKRLRNLDNEFEGTIIQPIIEAENTFINPTELSYLEGATSNLQYQIDSLPSLYDNNQWQAFNSFSGDTVFTGSVLFNDELTAPHCSIVPQNGDDLCNKAYVDSVMAAARFELFFNYSQVFGATASKLLSSSQLVADQVVQVTVPPSTTASVATFENSFSALGISKTIPSGEWRMTLFANITNSVDLGHFAFRFTIYATTNAGGSLTVAQSGYTPFVYATYPTKGSYTTSISLAQTDCSAYDNLKVFLQVINTRTSGQDGIIYCSFQFQSIYAYLLTSYSVLVPPSITETNNVWTGTNSFTQLITGATTQVQVTSINDASTYYPVFSNGLGVTSQVLGYDNVTTPFTYVPSTGTLSALQVNSNTIQSATGSGLTLKVNGGAANSTVISSDSTGITNFYTGAVNSCTASSTQWQFGVPLNMNGNAVTRSTGVTSVPSGAAGIVFSNQLGNTGPLQIVNADPNNHIYYRQAGTVKSHIFQTSDNTVDNLILTPTDNRLVKPTSITSSGQLSRSLNLVESTTGNSIQFYPNTGSGHLNPFVRPTDSQIAVVTSTPGTGALTLTNYSTSTTVGLRIDGTSVLIGAGGYLPYTTNPSSSIYMSGTTAQVKGNISMVDATPTISSSQAGTNLTLTSGSGTISSSSIFSIPRVILTSNTPSINCTGTTPTLSIIADNVQIPTTATILGGLNTTVVTGVSPNNGTYINLDSALTLNSSSGPITCNSTVQTTDISFATSPSIFPVIRTYAGNTKPITISPQDNAAITISSAGLVDFTNSITAPALTLSASNSSITHTTSTSSITFPSTGDITVTPKTGNNLNLNGNTLYVNGNQMLMNENSAAFYFGSSITDKNFYFNTTGLGSINTNCVLNMGYGIRRGTYPGTLTPGAATTISLPLYDVYFVNIVAGTQVVIFPNASTALTGHVMTFRRVGGAGALNMKQTDNAAVMVASTGITAAANGVFMTTGQNVMRLTCNGSAWWAY